MSTLEFLAKDVSWRYLLVSSDLSTSSRGGGFRINHHCHIYNNIILILEEGGGRPLPALGKTTAATKTHSNKGQRYKVMKSYRFKGIRLRDSAGG